MCSTNVCKSVLTDYIKSCRGRCLTSSAYCTSHYANIITNIGITVHSLDLKIRFQLSYTSGIFYWLIWNRKHRAKDRYTSEEVYFLLTIMKPCVMEAVGRTCPTCKHNWITLYDGLTLRGSDETRWFWLGGCCRKY